MSTSQAPAPTPENGRALMIRAVAFHITRRTENDRWVYSSVCVIDLERAKARSSAFMPRCSSRCSSMSLGLPVWISPRPSVLPSSTPNRRIRLLALQAEKANCLRYRYRITGNTRTIASMASSADRVPVIMIATRLNAVVNASKAIRAGSFTRAMSMAENGSVQTTNSAKKLRLTKVDAGLGPCGKYLKSVQNCSAVHSDATTAPQ
jgi:hypothetical protein